MATGLVCVHPGPSTCGDACILHKRTEVGNNAMIRGVITVIHQMNHKNIVTATKHGT